MSSKLSLNHVQVEMILVSGNGRGTDQSLFSEKADMNFNLYHSLSNKRQSDDIFFFFFQKIGFDILCNLSL